MKKSEDDIIVVAIEGFIKVIEATKISTLEAVTALDVVKNKMLLEAIYEAKKRKRKNKNEIIIVRPQKPIPGVG